jgi:thiamine biosynthesis lipoprotein
MSMRHLVLFSALVCGPLVHAAETEPDAHVMRRSAKAMGTVVSFVVRTDDEAATERSLVRAFAELQRIEVLMTDWKRPGEPLSDVVRVNEAAGVRPVAVAPETIEVVEKSLWIAKLSEGTFDVTYAAMRGLWQFDEKIKKELPDPARIAKQRALINWRDVVVDEEARTVFLRRAGMRIGLGGIAKGYAVDRCAAILQREGLHDFIIQAGGDLYASGRNGDRPWHVGVQDPRGVHGDSIANVALEDSAFSTAGDYERGFLLNHHRYHHIIDPRTGYPATASRSVTILAKSAFVADALDDAVFILGPKKGLALVESLPDVAAVVVDKDNQVWVSERLRGKLWLTHSPTPGD